MILINKNVKIEFIVINVFIVLLVFGFLKLVIVFEIVLIFVNDEVFDENVFNSKNNVILGIVVFIDVCICGWIFFVVIWKVFININIINFIMKRYIG